jgi:hypothetical protein
MGMRFGLAVLVAGAALALPATPANAAQALSVQPSSSLVDGQTVTVSGTGFDANGTVAVCEGIVSATPSAGDCGSQISFFSTDGSGSFSEPYVVRRFIAPGAQNGAVFDCADSQNQCGIGAANFTALTPISVQPITFAPQPPAHPRSDMIVKNRATQELYGDNFYTTSGAGVQHRQHALVDGHWTFALEVQNDGDVADDLIVSAPQVPGVQYFYGYYDITSEVTGAGFPFVGVQPGERVLFGMRDVGSESVNALVTVHPGLAPAVRDAAVFTFTSN